MGKNDNGNNGRTELVFVVDRSGSMGGLESDAIGGFNSMLSKQRTIAGECRVTTLLFDHRIETLHNHLDIREVNDLTSRDYWVRGSTALLDAIGLAIDRMIVTQRHTAAAYRAQHVLFVIITDGYENASRRYSLHQIKQMITYERERYHWEFVFLGANTAVRGGADLDDLSAPDFLGGVRDDYRSRRRMKR